MSIPTQEQLDEALASGTRSRGRADSWDSNGWGEDPDNTVPAQFDVGCSFYPLIQDDGDAMAVGLTRWCRGSIFRLMRI